MQNEYCLPRLPAAPRDSVNSILDLKTNPINAVAFALQTGRHAKTGKSLSKDLCMGQLCLQTYKTCAKAIHATETSKKRVCETDVAPSLHRYVQWGSDFFSTHSIELVESVIKPKIADLLSFYVSSADYSDSQIAAFVEGLPELLSVPPITSLQHDQIFERDMKRSVDQNPCVKIQRCHSLYPTHLSSPLNETNTHFGDSFYFGASRLSCPYFSNLIPFMLSLIRYDAFMISFGKEAGFWQQCTDICHEIEKEWRKVALFVDFIDPECRRLSELKEHKLSTQRRTAIQTAGHKAVKRTRSPEKYKDPLRNAIDATFSAPSAPTWKRVLNTKCGSSSCSALEALPHEILYLVAIYLTPRSLMAAILVSKRIARAVLPNDDTSRRVLIGLQLSCNVRRILTQYVNQLCGERFVYIGVAGSPSCLPEASTEVLSRCHRELAILRSD